MRLSQKILMCSVPIGAVGFMAPAARAVAVAKPLFTIVYTRTGDKPISGHLIAWTSRTAIIRLANGKTKRVPWAAITPSSAFTLRARLIDRAKVADWMALGAFGWREGAKAQARMAFNHAIGMDPSARYQVKKLMAARTPVPAKPSSKRGSRPDTDHARAHESRKPTPAKTKTTPSPSRPAPPLPPPPGPAPGLPNAPLNTIVRYAVPTKTQDMAEIKAATALARADAAKGRLQLRELQTRHFIVFSDWPRTDLRYLKRTLELGYRRVGKLFGVTRKKPIFIGKLAIFCIMHQRQMSDMQRLDNAPHDPNTIGYCDRGASGLMHLVIARPRQSEIRRHPAIARRQWVEDLVTNLGFAMAARYRSNRQLPGWMIEGLGKMVGAMMANDHRAQRASFRMSLRGDRVSGLFRGKAINGYFIVCQTMVETLVAAGRKNFVKMVNDLKDGMTFGKALRKDYGWRPSQLTRAWRLYVRKFR